MRLRVLIVVCGAAAFAGLVAGAAFVRSELDALGRAVDRSRALARLEAAAADLAISAQRVARRPAPAEQRRLAEAEARLRQELVSPLARAFDAGPVAARLEALRTALRDVAAEIARAAALAGACGDASALAQPCETADALTDAARRLRDLAEPHVAAAAADAERHAKTAELGLLGVVAGLGAVVLGFWTTIHARALRPLADLRDAFAIVGAGRLDHRAPEGSADEIGEILRRFNAMVEDLQRLSASRADLEAEIARRADLERALRRRNAELAQANAELDAFARIAAHDLRAPARGIATLAQWLIEDCPADAPPEHRSRLTMMRGRAERLDGLLGGLQRYVALGRVAGAAEPVDVPALARRIAAQADPAARFALETVDPDGPFAGRRALIEIVLRALIENAVRHHDRATGRIAVTTAREAAGRAITVADDGPGVPADLQERAFALFQTLRPRDEVEGAGLGLPIARKAARLMGGALTLESPVADGRGCAFTLRLPDAAPAD